MEEEILFTTVQEYKLPYTESGDWTFEKLANQLMNKDMLDKFTKLFIYLKIDTLFTREILSAFIISWFPDVVMETVPDTDKVRKASIIMSKTFIHELKNVITKRKLTPKFKKALPLYKSIFCKWMKKDRRILKEELINKFREFHITEELLNIPHMDKEYNQSWKGDIKSIKSKIRNKMNKLKPSKKELRKLDNIEITKPFNQTKNNKNTNNDNSDKKETNKEDIKMIDIDKIVREIGKETYWKNLRMELESEPTNWKTTMELLTEIRDRFIVISPKFINKIKTAIDIPYIQHLADQNILNDTDLFSIFKGIITCFKLTQSHADDTPMQKWAKDINDRFESEDFRWEIDIPKLFNDILIKLDRLEEVVEYYKNKFSLSKDRLDNSDKKYKQI